LKRLFLIIYIYLFTNYTHEIMDQETIVSTSADVKKKKKKRPSSKKKVKKKVVSKRRIKRKRKTNTTALTPILTGAPPAYTLNQQPGVTQIFIQPSTYQPPGTAAVSGTDETKKDTDTQDKVGVDDKDDSDAKGVQDDSDDKKKKPKHPHRWRNRFLITLVLVLVGVILATVLGPSEVNDGNEGDTGNPSDTITARECAFYNNNSNKCNYDTYGTCIFNGTQCVKYDCTVVPDETMCTESPGCTWVSSGNTGDSATLPPETGANARAGESTTSPIGNCVPTPDPGYPLTKKITIALCVINVLLIAGSIIQERGKGEGYGEVAPVSGPEESATVEVNESPPVPTEEEQEGRSRVNSFDFGNTASG
jgi:hypothetical protein